MTAYEQQGQVHLSIVFALAYGLGFATIAATLTHVICFYGKEIWYRSRAAMHVKRDVHTRLMEKYADVPQKWWSFLLAGSVGLSLIVCLVFKDEVQLPWWVLLLACVLAAGFTLPIGVITATTNLTPGLNIITEYIMGYILPGYPLANVCFEVYGYMSMSQAISFLADFKLGHYMKIPPRSMFMVQHFLKFGGYHKSTCLCFWGLFKLAPSNISELYIMDYCRNSFQLFCVQVLQGWWKEYNYVLSAAMDAGVAFMAVAVYFLLHLPGAEMSWWGTDGDHCPLATCPTVPGIFKEGCLVFH
ncbi:hypothetical protein L7F22_051065 [Adiantum nelumboides]|nr:hypothetical protein [Adiantum nelumboides]